MAHSSTKGSALFARETFWERATIEPSLRWERCRIVLKLAILAKDGISIDILREATPDKVSFPPEPIYEETWTTALLKVNKIAKSKTHGSTHAKQLTAGIPCGNRPWKFCDRKAVSLKYLRHGILAPKNRLFKLLRFPQKICLISLIRFSPNKGILSSTDTPFLHENK